MKRTVTFRLLWATPFLLLPGCIAPLLVAPGDISDEANLSTNGHTAEIVGTTRGLIEPDTCHLDKPARTKRLVVDAGSISIIISCFYYGDLGPSSPRFAAVAFDAEEGHRYSLRKANTDAINGVDVVDLSDKGRLIARTLLLGNRIDASASIGKAFVFVSGELGKGLPGDVSCQLRNSDATREKNFEPVNANWRQNLGKYLVEPGRVVVEVSCSEWSSSFGPMKSKEKKRYRSLVEIDAESNHLYAISLELTGDACVVVNDVTTKSRRIGVCSETISEDVN